MKKAGKVYLVGAGPGDPGLITYKGMKLLKTCDAVVYDRLVSDRLLEQVREDCERIYVGKTVGSHELRQEEINQILIDKAFTYSMVVRLKGGDPFVFGRGGEELIALREQGIPCEVVPGVTSAIAAAAAAGVPVTHRGYSQSFHVITGHTAEQNTGLSEDLKAFARADGTLILLMGMGNLEQIRRELLENGKPADTPALVVANGTTKDQKEVKATLADIDQRVKESGIKAPAVLILGKTAELNLKSTIVYPLSGVKVGITGTKGITDKLTEQLEEQGAQTEIISTSEIYEYENNSEFTNALASIEQFRWVVFTSTNAVRLFFKSMLKLQIDHRRLSHLRFAAVGSGTEQALQQQGYWADLVPKQYTAVHLAEELSCKVNPEDRILIPRARQGSEGLIEILDKKRLLYEDIKIYDVMNGVPNRESWKQQIKQLDYLTFASSSGVESLLKGWEIDPKELFAGIKVVCIGEATLAALRSYGYEKAVVAAEASTKGLVELMIKDWEETKEAEGRSI